MTFASCACLVSLIKYARRQDPSLLPSLHVFRLFACLANAGGALEDLGTALFELLFFWGGVGAPSVGGPKEPLDISVG